MVSLAIAPRQSSLPSVASGRPRLLIVTDSSERLSRLRASLNLGEIEITGATSPEEMCCACRSGQDVAVVDVSPERLGDVLKTLRRGAGSARIPVLVEAERISADPGQAGLLASYRAMPCRHTDLVRLARLRMNPPTERPCTRDLL